MTEKEVLDQLIETLDDLIVLKGWKELVSDMGIKMAIEKGYAELKKYSPEIAVEFIETATDFIEKDRAGLVDNAADLAAELFKKLFKNLIYKK